MSPIQRAQEKLNKLKAALKNTRKLFVLAHDNPDPDSIACAVTLAAIISELFGVRTYARYSGIVGRAENRVLIRRLGLRIKLLSKNEIRPKDDVAFVDCQPHTGNVTLPRHCNPLIVIDHHPLRKTTKVAYADIRVDYGATATILGEYLLGSGLEVSSQLATALCYGISSETQRLGREATKNDMDMYLALFVLAKKKLLAKIEYPKLPRHYFVTLNQALHQSYVYKNVVVSQLGDIPEPDFVPIVADLLLRCERISWSLCLGRFKDKILVSVRTSREDVHAGRFLRALMGKLGTAGGHGMIAGGQIPLNGKTENQIESTEREMAEAFFKKIGHKDVNEVTPLLLPDAIEKKK
jgi:nanoRNase/pAp phosphatase (c-di-AMP/oligoRNAs hydrolase)